MKKTFVSKKGFTLIEVILALIIAAMASVYVIQTIAQNNFNSAIEDTQETIKEVIKDGIADTTNGYANGSGNNCSVNHDFTGLTTARLRDCLGWTTKFTLTGTKLSGETLMQNYGNCTVETTVDPTTNQRFIIFVDCSTVDYNNRATQRLEEAIKFVFERELNDIWISTDDNAINITTTTGGTNTDGQIRATFGL